MDDLYAINVAKTEFREAFNHDDPSRILEIADPGLINFSDRQPSEFGESGWRPSSGDWKNSLQTTPLNCPSSRSKSASNLMWPTATGGTT